MAFCWVFAINIAIFLIQYKYRPYAVYLHYITGGIVGLFTIISSLGILIPEGISSSSNIYFHKVFGTIIIGILSILLILGLLGWLLSRSESFNSTSIYYIRLAHRILGYILTLASFIQVTLMFKPPSGAFWLLILWELACVVALVVRKIWWPTLEQKATSAKDLQSTANKLTGSNLQ